MVFKKYVEGYSSKIDSLSSKDREVYLNVFFDVKEQKWVAEVEKIIDGWYDGCQFLREDISLFKLLNEAEKMLLQKR